MLKLKPLLNTISSLLSYAGCIVVSLLVMYYLNGTIGIFMASALICGFILSLLLTLAALKSLRFEISADDVVAAKGETINCVVKLYNTLILPVPVVEITAGHSAHFAMDEVPLYKTAAAGKAVNTVKIPMKAVHSGLGEIRIERVCISDFLGIFGFTVQIPEQTVFKVAVYPDIPDAAVQTDFLKTTNSFIGDDDEEEESNESSQIPTGQPGYDHREYIPGDPIKRINYKMSSKRNIYMIRLDEVIRGTGQMFFLDCPVGEETERSLAVRDRVIEGALAMFMMLVREGRDAFFYYLSEGLWLGTEIHELNDVYRLQEILSAYSPSAAKTPVPTEIINAGKTPICFTAASKDAPQSALEIASKHPNALIISAADSGLNITDAEQWVITEDFEFIKSSEK